MPWGCRRGWWMSIAAPTICVPHLSHSLPAARTSDYTEKGENVDFCTSFIHYMYIYIYMYMYMCMHTNMNVCVYLCIYNYKIIIHIRNLIAKYILFERPQNSVCRTLEIKHSQAPQWLKHITIFTISWKVYFGSQEITGWQLATPSFREHPNRKVAKLSAGILHLKTTCLLVGESVGMIIPYIKENKTCLKPPTSLSCLQVFASYYQTQTNCERRLWTDHWLHTNQRWYFKCHSTTRGPQAHLPPK